MAEDDSNSVPSPGRHRTETASWKMIVAEYQKPDFWLASGQLLNSVGSYVLLWYLIYLSLSVSWWLTIPLAVLAGGFLIRIFIIFHDCGHGSFFKSRRANAFWGFVTGLISFTPFYQWRKEHSIHHATSGDLSRRGVGDIWTMTVQEYLEASRLKRFSYRLARNPFFLFLIAPVFLFIVMQRIPISKVRDREWYSVWWMNFAILVMVICMSRIYGFVPYLIIQLTATAVAGAAGVWLFYVQHQFEDVYWEHADDWDYTAAAMQGSSYYKLPRVLQWFSGNIGFHHIHHLSSRIPNYHLERCHRSNPLFQQVKPLTLLESLKSLTFRLWDESSRKLVGFRRAREIRKKAARDTPGFPGCEPAVNVREEGQRSKDP